MKNRICKICFSVMFLLMLGIPLALTSTEENVISVLENRTLAAMPKLRNEDGSFNKRILADFETWFNDHVGLRQFLYETNSKLEYEVFHTAATPDVHVGADGWLFYDKDGNMEIASGDYPGLSESDLKVLCNKQIAIRDKLKEQGIDYALVLSPSKVSIYPEYIRGNFSVVKTPVDIVADYIEANSDVRVIRVKDGLLQAKEENPEKLLYFKTDTHWNSRGAYTAYQKIITQLAEWKIIDSEPAEVTFYESASGLRDLTLMMVDPEEVKYQEQTEWSELVAPKARQMKDGEGNTIVQNYVSDYGIRRGDYFEHSDQSLPSVVVFADSMFMDWQTRYLAENFSSMTGIWDHNVREELISALNPDLVLVEITERSINTLKNTSEEYANSTSFELHEDTLDFYFCDFGAYEKLYVPVWSQEGDQDDIIWYEAERSDDSHWHISIDREHHGSGIYNIHVYKANAAGGELENVKALTYDTDGK